MGADGSRQRDGHPRGLAIQLSQGQGPQPLALEGAPPAVDVLSTQVAPGKFRLDDL
jgi:hypothetical protein